MPTDEKPQSRSPVRYLNSVMPQLDYPQLEPYYSWHVAAMTEQGLHTKSDIAAELAYRDKSNSELSALLNRATNYAGELELRLSDCRVKIDELTAELAVAKAMAASSKS
jgi:hypothetical protein